MIELFTFSLYGLAAVLLGISFLKDQGKTLCSLKKAGKMFVHVLPQFLSILILTGFLLAVLSPETIRGLIGEYTGFVGMLLSSFIGAITLVPVMIAFPIVAQLLHSGAGIAQAAVFLSALTTVGIVTLPMEIQYLGKKAAILRNTLAFLLSFVVACLMGVFLA